MINIGLFGSCQLHLRSNTFFNENVKSDNNLCIKFSLPFYIYDPLYFEFKGELDYEIFDGLDILIIENNTLNNNASSEKIISYCLDKKIKVIRTFLVKMPVYPINWSGYGENKNDYLNEIYNKTNLEYNFRNLE
jgi:hypothetical protein